MKAQSVRLIDVFVLGPFMVWAGVRLKDRANAPMAGYLLALAGVGTVVYNAENYVKIAKG